MFDVENAHWVFEGLSCLVFWVRIVLSLIPLLKMLLINIDIGIIVSDLHQSFVS